MAHTGPCRGYIISHTHWDREWYRPFQVFRAKLVDVLDEVLDALESDPRYRFFHLDGQTIVIDDYLDIRPEAAERLRALMEAGRLIAGPWFVAPDETLPSGEALVRNLLRGTRSARSWGGEPLPVGYELDMFGHISQFPQICRGFGIESAMLFRGVNDEGNPAEMIWEGTDGTRLLLLRLPNDVAYSDFFYYVRHPARGKPFDIDEALGRLKELVEFERDRSTTAELLFMDGVDHIEILPELPDLIDAWNARPELRELCEMSHASLPEYLGRIHEAVDRDRLPVLRGEIREPNRSGTLSNLFYGIHSSHPRVKRWNDECESLLTLAAEPWSVAASLAGAPYPAGLLRRAWQYLLENHPHDSICGCSVDQVHKDMEYRFDQCRLIGQEVLQRAVGSLAKAVDTAWIGEGSTGLVLLNASGAGCDEVCEVEIAWPHPRPPHFRLYSGAGVELPYQIIRETPAIPGMAVNHREIPHPTLTDRLRMAVPVSLPSVGLTALAVRPQPRPVSHLGSLSPAPGVLDNGLIRIEVGLGGALILTDLRTDQVYANLLTLEDTGDVGDGWTYRAPLEDEAATTVASGCTVTLETDGPLQATLRIDYTGFLVPRSAARGGRGRSDERIALPVTTRITLRRDQAFAACRIDVDNVARDHRLRAHPGRHITLIEQGAALPRLGAAARHRLLAELATCGITLMTRTRVEALEPGAVRLADGRKVTAAFILSAAGGRPQGWLQGTGLPLHDGFITVDAFLRAQAHPQVFAVGDCAHLAHAPRPKAGVFAVRQAPVLAHNLRSTLAGGRLKRYDPQRDYLKLISLGSRAALADKWGLPLRGRWLWTLKDRIDRRFMRMFHSLPAMPAPAIPAPAALGMAEALGEAPLCGGCGARVGPDPLHKALAALPAGPGVGLGVGLELGTGDDAAVLRHGAHLQVIATGHLRALTEDPYLMARIAAIHALGDVWAMGAAPQLALASLTLPRLSDSLLERSLHEIVAGAGAVFSAAGAVIAGGHTSIGAELVIGFTVTGTAQGRVLTKAGAQAGDRLILTKPLGSGTLLAAEMLRKARGADIAALWPFLQQPQGAASAILAPVAHAMTDIAGFGLAGHLDEMLRASGLCARITLADLPLFQGAEGLAARGVASSLEPANRAALAGRIDAPETPRARLLFDPQTAGGLLAAVPEARAEATCAELAGAGYTAAVIGTTLPAAGQSAIIARPM